MSTTTPTPRQSVFDVIRQYPDLSAPEIALLIPDLNLGTLNGCLLELAQANLVMRYKRAPNSNAVPSTAKRIISTFHYRTDVAEYRWGPAQHEMTRKRLIQPGQPRVRAPLPEARDAAKQVMTNVQRNTEAAQAAAQAYREHGLLDPEAGMVRRAMMTFAGGGLAHAAGTSSAHQTVGQLSSMSVSDVKMVRDAINKIFA